MTNLAYLRDWAEAFLPDSTIVCGAVECASAIAETHQESILLTPLSGDAGFRQYFRLNTKLPLLAVLAPIEYEDTLAFVNVSLCFKRNAIRTPKVYAVDYQSGFLLLEDFGCELLLPNLSGETVDIFYTAAETELLKIQKIAYKTTTLPYYDEQRLMSEMALFSEWFVQQLLGIELNPSDHDMFDEVFRLLSSSALEQPQVVVHRDYHSRNLMLLDNSQLGIIDFQDAVIGPVTYDLVSLLRDCYVRWSPASMTQRAVSYAQRAAALGIIPSVPEAQFVRWFDLMGLQRHIKVLGVFARLWLRDSKQHYLHDLPLVIRYTMEQLQRYPELSVFRHWFEQRVIPKLLSQPWYQPWETAGDK